MKILKRAFIGEEDIRRGRVGVRRRRQGRGGAREAKGRERGEGKGGGESPGKSAKVTGQMKDLGKNSEYVLDWLR